VIDLIFIVEHPSEKGIVVHETEDEGEEEQQQIYSIQNDRSDSSGSSSSQARKGIGFWKAWLIPGVLAYSLSYFCLKFANYGIMYWLPLFLE